MDLKIYYRKLRETAAEIREPHVIVVSLATPDGGKAGVASEVPREVAAKMIVNGQARLATEQERQQYHERAAEARRAAEQAALAERIQVTVVSDSEGRRLRASVREPKGQPVQS
jgi:hypothetical protein